MSLRIPTKPACCSAMRRPSRCCCRPIAAAAVQRATSLDVPADHPVARRIAGQAHSDLLMLERVINEKTGKLFTQIRVEDVRRSVAFFGSTAGEGGWRVA